MKRILLVLALLSFSTITLAQSQPPVEGDPQDGWYPPQTCSPVDYTTVDTYEQAKTHNHTNLISVDAVYIGRAFVGPTGNTGDTFLGNAIDFQTTDGCQMRVWCEMSANMNYYIPLLYVLSAAYQRPITVTYDTDCGLATYIALR